MSRSLPSRVAVLLAFASAVVSLALAALAPAATAGVEEAAAQILASMPEGSEQDRAWWLYETAAMTPDAHLARRLMDEVSRKFAGAPAARAGLWKVRFFMAAGDTGAAAREIGALEVIPKEAVWGAEARFWALLLDGRALPDSIARDRAVPPWGLMSQIASIGASGPAGVDAQRALALEGAARRWGILGPWLWRLATAQHPWLKEAAEAVLASPGLCLAGTPELTDIRQVLWESAAKAPVEPEALAGAHGTLPTDEAGAPAPRFSVQVGAFLEEAAARGLVRELISHGFPAHLQRPRSGEDEALYLVRIGRGCRLAEAESLGIVLSRALMLPYQIIEEDRAADGPEPVAEPQVSEGRGALGERPGVHEP